MKTYSELIQIPSFGDRFEYLKLDGRVGLEKFGEDRYLNQLLYHNPEWKRIRNYVIARDNGCDLAHSDFPIFDRIYIHHINPISKEDLINRSYLLLDMENLICVSFDTHQSIHYGAKVLQAVTIRTKNDTCPWRN